MKGDFMKKWLKKTLILSVAFLTFGLITPNHEIWDALENNNNNNSSQEKSIQTTASREQQYEPLEEYRSTEDLYESEIDPILAAAKEQSYIKFGSRIAPIIGEEFEQKIFPKLQEVITASIDKESLKYVAITEQPSGDYGEKIFHLKDGFSGKDLLRFHVRTEKRPQEGYYYNFHYHTKEDKFVTHHDLGEIYWSKNTPPKWLS